MSLLNSPDRHSAFSRHSASQQFFGSRVAKGGAYQNRCEKLVRKEGRCCWRAAPAAWSPSADTQRGDVQLFPEEWHTTFCYDKPFSRQEAFLWTRHSASKIRPLIGKTTVARTKSKRTGETSSPSFLLALERLADSLDTSFPDSFRNSAAFRGLVLAIYGLHGSFMEEEEIEMFLVGGWHAFRTTCPHVGALGDPINSATRDELIHRISTRIDSLPHSYTVRLEIPSFFIASCQRIPLHSTIDLVTQSCMHRKTPENPKDGIMIEEWITSFLEFRIDGYATPFFGSQTLHKCFSTAKQLAFALVNLDLCKEISNSHAPRGTFRTEQLDSTTIFSLEPCLARSLARLSSNTNMLFLPPQSVAGAQSAGGIHRKKLAMRESEIADALNYNLIPLRDFILLLQRDDFSPISAAIEWYQDSRCADNQTFAYLAACIGLESLLGENGYMQGMSSRLGDRFSFLLGTSRSNREKRSKEFAEVLEVRGKLVHAKAARLRSLSDFSCGRGHEIIPKGKIP